MKSKPKLLLVTSVIVAASLLGASGAQSQPLAVLPTVGPGGRPGHSVTGYLVVYTDTESPINTGDIQYYPHTSYRLYDSRGALVRWVRNHLGERDESPARVSLPPGRYTVVGRSETQGEVAVPVIIGSLRTTVVNLEKRTHDGTKS